MNTKNALSATKFYLKKFGIIKTIKKVCKALDNRIFKKNIFDYQNDRYELWIKNNEPTEKEMEEQKKVKFGNNPKISLVVPMYNTNTKYFEELVESVINQTYSNWELCLADGSQKKNEELDEIIKKDKRIKYKFLNENKGIAGNSNAALEMVKGDFIALLDHDDLIPPFCLYEVVKTINENPKVEFIYTDEDKIENGKRCDVHFKPDFAIDTLRSNNYITHLSVFKKSLMDKLEGFKEGYDGAQDFDLILRTVENTNNIIHIPKVLYHWRIDSNSTSTLADSKPYAYEAGIRVIKDHLKRQRLAATVNHGGDIKGVYEVEYTVKGHPKVSIIINNYGDRKQLNNCINRINKITTYKNYEIMIIENYINNSDYIKVLNETIRKCDGCFILRINSDLLVQTPNWIEKLLGFAQREEVGAVGAKIYHKNKTIEHAGIEITTNIASNMYEGTKINQHAYFGRESTTRNVTAITGKCILVKKELYDELGCLDENFCDILSNLDFCLKLREKGYLNVYNPYVELIDCKNQTAEEELEEELVDYSKKEMFMKKWKNVINKKDVYTNINFINDGTSSIINTDKIIL